MNDPKHGMMEGQKFNPGDVVLFVADLDDMSTVVPVEVSRRIHNKTGFTYEVEITKHKPVPTQPKNLMTLEEWEEFYKIFLSKKISAIPLRVEELGKQLFSLNMSTGGLRCSVPISEDDPC